jgi:hypothetical protein
MNESSKELYENLVTLVEEINDFIDAMNHGKTGIPEGMTIMEMKFGDFVVNFEGVYYEEKEDDGFVDLDELEDDDDNDDELDAFNSARRIIIETGVDPFKQLGDS